MVTFSPEEGSNNEFTETDQTVVLTADGSSYLRIVNVTYSLASGIELSDMDITWEPLPSSGAASTWFRYRTEYSTVVNRKSYYTLHPTEYVLTRHSVENISQLPESYHTLYRVDNPDFYTPVTFTIHVKETIVDPESGVPAGPESDNTYTWVDMVSTNYYIHRRLLINAVNNGEYARKNGTVLPQP